MSTDSISLYETHAHDFLQSRDSSRIGTGIVEAWARSVPRHCEVMEIACGGGRPVSLVLINEGLKLWAIDSSQTLVTAFEERFPDATVRCESALDSDFFQKQFDAAISIGFIFLLSQEDQIKLLDQVARILRPRASFLFTAPKEVGTWKDALTGHSCVSLGRDVYEDALEQSGFRLVAYHEDSGKNNYYEVEKVADGR
ncbi:MAG: class I SAM-dependent methyltransferase [Pseudomonadota bacterium]